MINKYAQNISQILLLSIGSQTKVYFDAVRNKENFFVIRREVNQPLSYSSHLAVDFFLSSSQKTALLGFE